MRTVEEIKMTMDYLYKFDVMKKTRKRKYAYARKAFTVLASNYGHTNEAITAAFGINHDVIIYGIKTFDVLNKIDIANYNRCIDRLSLDIKKIPSMKYLQPNNVADDIYETMKSMKKSDLLFFKRHRFDPFVKDIKLENLILGNEQKLQ